ncbi:WXG100 family type VII secretion target [Herpetosiphon llansteffanensis]|uniref:WXG100 family type VII secretion target n=1 Tax=Herpetosiphon llansteffanensis TaxID=2094568 RepID=UPI000D7C941F|nr:WXG100 family type VII secretion target [Herpetosiphon llansteffanensis]
MTAPLVEVQYDVLAQVAQRFQKQAQAVQTMHQSLKQTLATLQNGAWQGQAAQAFFKEFETEIAPTLQRLIQVFETQQSVTIEIGKLFKTHEEEAARLFHHSQDGVLASKQRGKGVFSTPPGGDPAVTELHDSSRDRTVFGFFTDKYEYEPRYKTFKGNITTDGISAGDVTQGYLGDCYFMAALASVAQQNPDLIKNAIADNGDGTYTVTFYEDGKPVKVTVDSDFPVKEDSSGNSTNNLAYAQHGSTPDELWPMILEKAYAQHTENSYEEIEGGWPGDAVELLTGKAPTEISTTASTPEQTKTVLQDLNTRLSNGDSVTVATRTEGWFEDTTTWPDNVVANHAYSVEKVDVEKGLIYLRNPWGTGSAPQPMSLEDFNKYYNHTVTNPLK